MTPKQAEKVADAIAKTLFDEMKRFEVDGDFSTSEYDTLPDREQVILRVIVCALADGRSTDWTMLSSFMMGEQ